MRNRINLLLGRTAAMVAIAMLLVCVVSARWGVLWIRHGSNTWAEIDVGAVLVGWVTQSAAFAPSSIQLLHHDGWGWSGWKPRIESITSGGGIVSIPIWIPAILLAGLSLWLGQSRGQSHSPLCRTCGYNLTGNVSGICPECGRPIPPPRSKCRTPTPGRTVRNAPVPPA